MQHDVSSCLTSKLWEEEEKRQEKLRAKLPPPKESSPAQFSNRIIVAALIVAASIIVAALISRPSSGARYKSIGTDRIFDVQTGEVKWAEPENQVSEKRK